MIGQFLSMMHRFHDKELKDIKAEEFLDVVRKHAEDGVDFVTIHARIK